ncbi:DNA polymerase-3 subunit gamma/tau [Herbaspirillum sp. Sphag1AN]|uniref:DNA polymerase III subunit gamma/tau n=1 Tax=unclassified Herbaspirillum TaxID=2624150 RepID=UPI00160BA917|nr:MULTISPECIES: DNA polymerase III subunit gamma/tau [unclassified Herbaspirillum]MBB3211377.1 DNA polymerase-3 subunit gamma/tau [Herbaspirillum sp. Sphag1AN]MBB3245356.1 DNA polymerase-3 subunit gamma/tau [Herbaspirillum sp. Sphag64]
MSYQVLARKYRPRSFETLVGQEHVVRALTHALEQQRLHHAYLFTGTRGVGKTTLSRILAKSLNCRGADGNGGITAQPCGVCEACTAIDAGRFVDYIEMDAASNRGVDEMAQLLEQAVYAPSNARFKVYMIDEVHMLTNHAFNSMLKTLEEPPEHIKFILATTDPQKIPVTVLSRCLQFNLKQMPPGHIISHLDNILGQENIEFEAPALRLLAQGAHGSMRDALSLTDQAIAYAAGKVTLDAVQGMLGALDQSYLIRVLDALATHDGQALLAVADEMATRSLSYNAALQDLATLLHQIALAQTVPAALAEDLPQREDIVRLAAQFNLEEAQLFYQIAVHGRNELGLAPDEYAGFSMTLLRMLAFRPVAANAASIANGVSGGNTTSPARVNVAPPRNAPAVAPLSAAPQVATASTPVARAPMVASSAASAPAAAPVGPAASARAAALEAARVASGKSSPKPVAASPAPPAVSVPAAPVQTTAATTFPAAENVQPPWDEEPAAGNAQKKTEQPAVDVGSDGVSPASPERPVPASAPAPANAITPAMAAQTAQIAAELGWDGNWPHLSAELPLRGMVQQMAQQSELIRCDLQGNTLCLYLRIPVETLRAAGNVEKLSAALGERFNRAVRVETEIGAVSNTANARAQADRAERQREAEMTIQTDPFVQTLMREFGATVVPGSIHPILN